MAKYKVGETVVYKPVGGPDSNTSESTGTIVSVLEEPGEMTDRNVDASPENPRYEIENTNTGKKSAIKEDNILRPA
ncbi:MAG: hypothetical protein M1823_000234 [Watsoniomyces obsoletus]|nr:MAG: hypothetical protein M1823_000234 [Watsoniomyces obsoletus]